MLALTAGCGFQISGGNAADDNPPDDANPDGMDGMIDAPIDAPIDMPIDMGTQNQDQDNDTIVDTEDNCVAIANTNQRNHDGDPFGDACDRCPHLISATDPDGDGDGVGDACDPRPTNNADRLALWVGFYDMDDIIGWGGQGTFTVTPAGYLQQTSANTTGFAPPGNVNVPFAMTELVIDNLINTNGDIGLAVTTTNGAQLECTMSKTGSNVNVRARQLGGSSNSAGWSGSFINQSRITLRLDLRQDVDCRASQGGGNVQQVAQTAADPTGRTYLGMVGIAARFDYLFVVDQMP